MNELEHGGLIALVTTLLLLTGVPVAFALGLVAIGFLVVFDGWNALNFTADVFFDSLNSSPCCRFRCSS